MKKILTASLVAIMAVTAANADIASTQYVNKKLTGDAENGTLSFTGAAAQQTTLQGAVNAIADSLSQNLGEGGNVSQQIGSAIQGLTGEVSGTGVVTAISQTNGKVTATLNKIGDDQVDVISQDKIDGLKDSLDDKQDKANMIGLVGENYTIPEGKGNEVYLTSDATAKMIDNKMNIFVDNTFADTLENVEDLQEDLGTVTSENMGTAADNVAGAIREVVDEIDAMDADLEATPNNVIVGITEVDGKLTEVTSVQIKDAYIASDAAIAKTKLATDVQNSLSAADSAMQWAALKNDASWTTAKCNEEGAICSLVAKDGNISWEKVVNE